MKTVFSNHHEVCHKFNEQSQEYGRASNIFFEGDRIYSYGYHYLMAQFLTPQLIVINDTGYSMSTSKHISILRQATSDKTQVFTMRAEPKRVAEQINEAFVKLAHARKPEKYIFEIINLYQEFTRSYFLLGGYLSVNYHDASYSILSLKELPKQTRDLLKEIEGIYKGLNTDEQKKQLEQIKKRDLKLRKERKARELEKIAEEKEKFYNYERDYINRIEFDLLRVSECGEFVETSQRVKIPMQEAKRYYKLLNSGANMRGEKIAQYVTKSFNDALNIGCHKIDKQEAQRIGNLILNI